MKFARLKSSLWRARTLKVCVPAIALALAGLFAGIKASRAKTQIEGFETGINRGAPMINIALTQFPAMSQDTNLTGLTKEFNEVLWNDLDNAGIFKMVSRSLYPVKTPVDPGDVDFKAWGAPEVGAQMLVFGKTEMVNGNLVVTGRVYDIGNPANPVVGGLAKRYVATMNEISTREAAHRFANEIVQVLGGGIPGINLTRIAFVSNRTGHPEIWVMDYDGFNEHPITSYGSYSTTPRWSPDNTRLAFTSYAMGNPDLFLFSLETNKRLTFPRYKGLNTTPSWSPDGKKIAFCSSMSGDPEIYVSDVDGRNLQRLTFSPGVDISPAWNTKTGNEMAFVSDRSGSAQIYLMSSDGTNVRRLITGGGDASSPAWSPNGLLMAFHWRLTDTGTYDIYLNDISSGRTVQITHDAGRNEHPSWSPDGRHLVFESTRGGTRQIWTMLADGNNPKQLTKTGENWNGNWSN